MSCSTRLRKLLLPLLEAVKEGEIPTFKMRSAASQALFLVGKGIKKPSQGRLRRVSKRSTKNEETAKIREAVFKRADEICEAARACRPGLIMGGACGGFMELDHFAGGSGRRTETQTVENTWGMCNFHHRLRTYNFPNAEYWNDLFRRHCETHGYPVVEHIVHEPIARKAQ